MKHLFTRAPGQKSWEDVPDPVIQKSTDIIVKMVATPYAAGFDILKGDVPEVELAEFWERGIGVITESALASRKLALVTR